MINKTTNRLASYDEEKRLEMIHQKAILDTAPEERFDRFTREAAEKLNCPISTVSIIDKDREWYKSGQGLTMTEAPIAASFCVHAMKAKNVFIVEDASKDPRFAQNPMVVGEPHIRAYAGVALYDRVSGLPIGAFCVKDLRPRIFSLTEINSLIEIAGRVEEELNK